MKPAKLVTSTDYAHPHRPLPLRLANGAGSLAKGFGLRSSFDFAGLLESARRGARLDDFGAPYFRVPLEVLARSLESEAGLHPLGRTILRSRLVATLANRLRVEALLKEHPEIDEIPVRRPIVIAGLQRSGTTLLHRLIAADPRARALLSWEALNPVPLPGEGRTGTAKRRRAARWAERGLRHLYPEFFAIHPVEADAPEEDILLLDLSFATETAESLARVPTYAAWLETFDVLPAYRYFTRVLKALLWQRPRDFFVLKTPNHMEYMKELLTVLPDAVVVQTHRDPLATTPSFCSMVAHARGIFSDQIDPREIGRHWLRKVRRMTDCSLAVRDGGKADSFLDVSYYDLMKEPLSEVRRIYAKANLELTPEAEGAMEAVLLRDTQHRYGRHVYSARDFGLSRALIEETLGGYRARFQIPHEKEREDHAQAQKKASGIGHHNPVTATITGVVDLFARKNGLAPIAFDLRLAGQTALVTGATSGLGKAVATDLARRGARVILACRSGIPMAGEEIARVSGSRQVEMLELDLADLDSVVELTDELARRNETIDLLVCNAGVMPAHSRQTAQGFELMFGVHYLANHLLARRLLANGVIPNDVFAKNGRKGSAIPRIVFVSSETHRSSAPLDFDHFGAYVEYGLRDGLSWYGTSKLALVTFATELSRRLGQSVGVHALCPGPVNSRLAREAPAFSKPVLGPVMWAFFRTPAQAADPVLYLAAAPELAGETGWYLHLMQRKEPSPLALDPENGRRLWEKGEALLADRLG